MSFLRSIAWVLVSIVAFGIGCSNDGDGNGGGGQDCPAGTEGCPCDNARCDGSLQCASNRCVDFGGSGGSGATGGSGAAGGSGLGGSSGGNAGTAQGGSTGGSTGGSAGATGGDSGTGSGGTAGSPQAGSAGMAGASGSAGSSCGDTSSDWQNCGSCGRACDNGGERCAANTCCSGGACTPFFGPCFAESDGFANCNQACANIGETCVARGCSGTTESNGTTWYGWALGSEDRCETLGPISNEGQACDEVFSWEPNEVIKRCCCTDTH